MNNTKKDTKNVKNEEVKLPTEAKEGLFTRIGQKADNGVKTIGQHKGKLLAGLLALGAAAGFAYSHKRKDVVEDVVEETELEETEF